MRAEPTADRRPPGRIVRRSVRRAFTLLELVIVIGVIAILASILLPAVIGAGGAANTAKVVADIKDLEAGILAFERKFGRRPPSFLVLHEDSDLWSLGDATTLESLRVLGEIWPQWTPPASGSADLDWNQNGATPDTSAAEPASIALNGAECLMFFLGGGRADGTLPLDEQAYTGFSVNPLSPFVVGVTNRVGPFLEFKSSRLSDVDGDGMPEYLDPYPGQELPYIYLSSVRGTYRPQGVDGAWGTADDETLTIPLASPPPWPVTGPTLAYYKALSDEDPATGAPGTQIVGLPTGVPYERDAFQIISPGEDREYGFGGLYVDSEGGQSLKQFYYNFALTAPTGDITDYVEPDRKSEADNVASFAGGRL